MVTEDQGFGCQYVSQPFTSRQHWLKKLCAKAGVRPFDFHGMRHLTATILFHAGESLSVIQAVLRHESPQTTVRYLKSLGLEQTRDALESVMSNRGPGKVLEFKQKKAAGGD